MQYVRMVSSAILLTALAAPAAIAQSAPFTLVNAASYGSAIASDSVATIFGGNLAQTTASATLDANGQLPVELASTRVEINGVAAPLFYVSPGQINLVVPGGLTAGTATVVIRSTVFGSTRSGAALVRAVAPGVFTSDASGAGPGAILNAVTYRPAPFVVQTADIAADTRTRIAVYGTGLRYAGTVTALAQDSAGNRHSLTVEYAGVAPGFFGLDQVNLLLPPDLDGAGTVSLSLTADGNAANVVTFQMNLLAPGVLRLATLTLSPTFLNAGDSAVLTVGLNGVARAGGFAVGLRSNSSAAQVTPQITIPEGKTSAPATVATSAVNGTQGVTITAQAGGVTETASLQIDPANSVQLAGLSASLGSILGGKNLTGTVTLTGNAPPGSVNIAIASDNGNVRPPAVVTVPFGKSSADFAIATLAVTSAQTVTLTASLSQTTASATLTLLPPLELALGASAVVGGRSVTGTVTLGDPAPVTGAPVALRSGDNAVQVPPVTIAAGQSSQTFTLTTSAVTAARAVSISATYAGSTQTVLLTVNPPAAVTLSSLTIAPDHVVGGNSTQATVTLTGPAGMGGVRVDLQSSSLLTASVSPNFGIIPQGQNSAVFTITTSRFPGVVTFTATAGGVSKTASLTVQ
jgi:uncharacterized protein (TIGR03437 family)